MTTNIIFNAKNLNGEIRKISYDHENIKDMPLLISNAFEDIQTIEESLFYETTWFDEDGNEKVIPKNDETIFVLFRYINIPIIFIKEWVWFEKDTNYPIEEYTLEIEYENFSLGVFYKKDNNRFYSETMVFNILEDGHEDGRCIIDILEKNEYFTSIKDLFFSLKDSFKNIPENFVNHIGHCVEEKWNQYK